MGEWEAGYTPLLPAHASGEPVDAAALPLWWVPGQARWRPAR